MTCPAVVSAAAMASSHEAADIVCTALHITLHCQSGRRLLEAAFVFQSFSYKEGKYFSESPAFLSLVPGNQERADMIATD